MTHPNDDLLFLQALADQELDAGASLALEKRLEAEPALAAEYARIQAVKQALSRLEKPSVSTDFYSRMAALGAPEIAPASKRRTAWPQDWRAMAASIVLTACVASGGTYLMTAPSATISMDDAIVNGHRRSLLAASPIDIASSDRHTVRPWFDAKLGVSPPTTDLAEAGFPLLGGRVDVIDGNAVPSLVYRHDKHLISVVAIPEAPGESVTRPPIAGTSGGYNIMRWSQSGFHYWAVSDLDAAELGVLVGDLRAK